MDLSIVNGQRCQPQTKNKIKEYHFDIAVAVEWSLSPPSRTNAVVLSWADLAWYCLNVRVTWWVALSWSLAWSRRTERRVEYSACCYFCCCRICVDCCVRGCCLRAYEMAWKLLLLFWPTTISPTAVNIAANNTANNIPLPLIFCHWYCNAWFSLFD